MHRVARLLTAALLGVTVAPEPASYARGPETERGAAHAELRAGTTRPAFAAAVPATTSQVVRTVSSRRYCRRIWCTVTQAWQKGPDGAWMKVRQFRSTIGARGWGKEREGDRRSPVGVYRIKITFSTTATAPGPMPWRRRKPTSDVSDTSGPDYNTWLEVPDLTTGDRPSMRYGLVVDYNHIRMRRGVGPAPVQGKGSGIFYHTSRPGHRWAPTLGCTQVGDPDQMRWLVRWLRPGANPRVVQRL